MAVTVITSYSIHYTKLYEVALRYQLGTILRHQLDEPDRALENYRAALGGDRNNFV